MAGERGSVDVEGDKVDRVNSQPRTLVLCTSIFILFIPLVS